MAAVPYIGELARFEHRHRRAIEKLTSSSRRVEELAATFPALLFALATGWAPPDKRDMALRLVQGGAPLRQVAKLLGLPWWLRRLPPECFCESLPSEIPDGGEFAHRIANLVPNDPSDATRWLARTLSAHAISGREYALWVARQRRFPSGVTGEISETLLAAWAWFSCHPDEAAFATIRTPWSGDISLRRALEEAKAWSLRLDLAVALGPGLTDSWFPRGECGAFEFVPLLRLDEFLAESVAMSNCLDQFADQIRAGRTRVFSIRKAGRPVADVEVGAHADDPAIPNVVQLRGLRNRRAGAEVWQATLAWLSAQTFRPLPRLNEATERARRQQLIRALWRPLLDQVKGTPAERRLQAVAFGKEISRSFGDFQVARGRAAEPVGVSA